MNAHEADELDRPLLSPEAEFNDSTDAPSEKELTRNVTDVPSSLLHSRVLVALITGAVVIVTGVVLGLGLGIGMRKHSPGVPTGVALPGPGGIGNGTISLEDWRLDTREYVLDMSWDVNAAPTTRHFDLVISEGQGWPDGVVRDMLFINGKFPGPLIEINRGDRIVVNVTNQLSQSDTSMHWHGLLQNGTNWFDGTSGVTQCGIPAGSSLVYNFTVENEMGTYWYHSHHGTQYLDGIFGPLIIHGSEEANARTLYDEDRIVLVQDWYHDFSTVNMGRYLVPNNENAEPIPNNGLINGASYFNCSLYGSDSGRTCYDNSSYTVFNLSANSRTRLRFINTGAFAEFEISTDNHTLSVIEADSTLVQPHAVHRLPIHVGQRYSAVLETNQSAGTNYWLRASMVTLCFTGRRWGVLDPETKAVISYSGSTTVRPSAASVDWADAHEVQCKDLAASDLVPVAAHPPPPATTFWRVDFSFGIGAYQMDYAKINGTIWKPLEGTATLIEAVDGLQGPNTSSYSVGDRVGVFDGSQFVLGVANDSAEVVDVLVYSVDEGAHPFHLHGHQFWILKTGHGPFDWGEYYDEIMPSKKAGLADSLRRDTLTIESYGWAVIRFVADNPGLWAFHCHVAWHMEAGMMMQFMSRADLLREMEIPADVRALCPAAL